MQTISRLRLALDPVRDTQATFRVTLDALARPGMVKQLPVAAADAPGNPWAVAILLTLLDHETSLAVLPSADAATIERFVRQRTGATEASVEAADFVLADAAGLDNALLPRLRRGTLEYPDDSTTLVVVVPSLDQEVRDGALLRLEGPGVPVGRTLRLSGVRQAVLDARAAVVQSYPCGVDLLFVDRVGRIAALPRSTRATARR